MSGRIKVINSCLLPLIMFTSPFISMSKATWNAFLSPIRNFLWRKNIDKQKAMHWGKWEWVARPKLMGGLGVLDPITHAKAMSSKYVVSFAGRR